MWSRRARSRHRARGARTRRTGVSTRVRAPMSQPGQRHHQDCKADQLRRMVVPFEPAHLVLVFIGGLTAGRVAPRSASAGRGRASASRRPASRRHRRRASGATSPASGSRSATSSRSGGTPARSRAISSMSIVNVRRSRWLTPIMLGAGGERALDLGGVVDLDQRVAAELAARRRAASPSCASVERRDDQQHRVGAGRAGLDDLVGVDHEVLAQQRQRRPARGRGEVARLPPKKARRSAPRAPPRRRAA